MGRKCLLAGLMLMLLWFMTGCGLIKMSREERQQQKIEKQLERTERKQQKEFDREYKKLKKQHFNNQSEQTLEMIKRNNKRNKKLDRHKKRTWFQRIFNSDPY